jgi:hypothetical protein
VQLRSGYQLETTYRVRRIPKAYDVELTRQLLKRILNLKDGDNGLRIKSLAVDATDDDTKVATIDFAELPALIVARGSRAQS